MVRRALLGRMDEKVNKLLFSLVEENENIAAIWVLWMA